MIPPEWIPPLLDAWDYFVHLAIVLIPLFIVASFVVGLAQEYLPPERVEGILHSYDEGGGNVVAAGIGAVTPFCSCSTIPILAGLLQAGAPLGLAFSFLLASPLVNWIAIFLLLGLFGLEITVLYAVVTLSLAVVGGIVIGRLQLDAHVKDIELSTAGAAAATDGGATCDTTPPTRSHSDRVTVAGRGAWGFFVAMFPYLLLGMSVGAVIHGIVPVSWIQSVLGPTNPLAVPLAAVAGAPIYISLEAMLPIAAALADQGIPIGTVLAFVIGSAGVSIPNLIMLAKLFDRRLLITYALTVVSVGVSVGFLFNILL